MDEETKSGQPIPINTGPTVNPSWTATVGSSSSSAPPPVSPQPGDEQPSTQPVDEIVVSETPVRAPEPIEPQPSHVAIPVVVGASSPDTGAETPLVPPSVPPQASTPIFAEPQAPKTSLVKWLILGMSVLVLVGLVIGLWWFGWLFGPPKDGKVALVKMNGALAKSSSYHVEGQLLVELDPSATQATVAQTTQSKDLLIPTVLAATPLLEETPTTLPLTPFDASFDQPVRVGLTFGFDQAGPDVAQGKVTLDLTTLGGLLPETIPASLSVDVRLIKGQVYLRVPALSLLVGSSDNKWLAFSADDVSSLTSQPVSFKPDYNALITSGTRLGFEQVGGVRTVHYQFILDPAALSQLDASLTEVATATQASLDLWLGARDFLPYQAKVVVESPSEYGLIKTTANAIMSGYGQQVVVVAPASNEVMTDGLNGLLAGGTEFEALSRDETRKNDLAEIAAALEQHKRNYGSYPKTGNTFTRTNDSATPLKVLVEQLYLSSLPTDPLAQEKWYGYKSADGSAYELWSILENTDDPEGVKRDGYFIYVVTNASQTQAAPAQPVDILTPSPTVSPTATMTTRPQESTKLPS